MLGFGIGLALSVGVGSASPTAVEPVQIPVDVALFATKAGDGATALDSETQSISISYGTTATSLRSSAITVEVGKRYRVFWTLGGTSGGQAGFGVSVGGPQYRPTMGGTAGENTFDFTATSENFHITFQRASAGTTTFSNIYLQEIPAVSWVDIAPNLFVPESWILSTGVTVDAETGDITIPATGTTISARQGVATEVGKLYRLRWVNNNNSTMCLIGTANGGAQFKSASSSDPVGSRTHEFLASTTTSWVQFQRSANGTAIVSDIYLQEVA